MNRTIYISNNILSLVEYNPCDDRALYESWLDPDVQQGFNSIYVTSYKEFENCNKCTRFTAMIRLDDTGEIVGTVGISPPEDEADLTIRIFKPYRRHGYGTAAFALATKYVTKALRIKEVHAGVYLDNIGSIKMLERCGYIPYTAGNIPEKHFITGEDIIQMDYIYRPITIRLAVPSDAPDLAEVMMRSWEVAYKDIIPAEYIREKNATRLDMFKRILPENIYTYVIQRNAQTVGIIRIAPPQDDDVGNAAYELHSIYLHPDYYRQGIGTQAMEFAYKTSRNLGKSLMIVWVFAENKNTINFYKKCGFAADGKVRTQDCGKNVESIRMRRDL